MDLLLTMVGGEPYRQMGGVAEVVGQVTDAV